MVVCCCSLGLWESWRKNRVFFVPLESPSSHSGDENKALWYSALLPELYDIYRVELSALREHQLLQWQWVQGFLLPDRHVSAARLLLPVRKRWLVAEVHRVLSLCCGSTREHLSSLDSCAGCCCVPFTFTLWVTGWRSSYGNTASWLCWACVGGRRAEKKTQTLLILLSCPLEERTAVSALEGVSLIWTWQKWPVVLQWSLELCAKCDLWLLFCNPCSFFSRPVKDYHEVFLLSFTSNHTLLSVVCSMTCNSSSSSVLARC